MPGIHDRMGLRKQTGGLTTWHSHTRMQGPCPSLWLGFGVLGYEPADGFSTHPSSVPSLLLHWFEQRLVLLSAPGCAVQNHGPTALRPERLPGKVPARGRDRPSTPAPAPLVP